MADLPSAGGGEGGGAVTRALLRLVSNIPLSTETPSGDPETRAKKIVAAARWKAGAVSGSLAFPPGPLGMVLVLPELFSIWKIQSQMVADIAAVFGRKPQLTQEAMLYCLFRHAASQLLRDV